MLPAGGPAHVSTDRGAEKPDVVRPHDGARLSLEEEGTPRAAAAGMSPKDIALSAISDTERHTIS